ncbi:MAG TPA: phospholipase D-like domain-containing protein, partial [Polyangia bacterium]|nr:phospholipase D-like domain-containing protein [Polyangia bacterium]
MYDVIVAGAGPAGIATAVALLREGVERVLCLDRARFPRAKPCGGGLTGHAEAALGALGLELRVPSVACPQGKLVYGRLERTVTMPRPVRVVRREDFDADLVAQAVARGVEVRVLYDYVGCRETPAAFFDGMRAAGVHVIAYHRYRFWRPRFWALIRRNHRKTLVCDGRVAFAGGLNIANEWVGLAEGGGAWLDAVVQVEGPAVADIEAVFLRTWNRRAKKKARLDPTTVPRPAPAGDAAVAVVSNSELRDRFTIRRAALHALRESRHQIRFANPYFVPDRGVLRAFQAAARRGVDVRLLL